MRGWRKGSGAGGGGWGPGRPCGLPGSPAAAWAAAARSAAPEQRRGSSRAAAATARMWVGASGGLGVGGKGTRGLWRGGGGAVDVGRGRVGGIRVWERERDRGPQSWERARGDKGGSPQRIRAGQPRRGAKRARPRHSVGGAAAARYGRGHGRIAGAVTGRDGRGHGAAWARTAWARARHTEDSRGQGSLVTARGEPGTRLATEHTQLIAVHRPSRGERQAIPRR